MVHTSRLIYKNIFENKRANQLIRNVFPFTEDCCSSNFRFTFYNLQVKQTLKKLFPVDHNRGWVNNKGLRQQDLELDDFFMKLKLPNVINVEVLISYVSKFSWYSRVNSGSCYYRDIILSLCLLFSSLYISIAFYIYICSVYALSIYTYIYS